LKSKKSVLNIIPVRELKAKKYENESTGSGYAIGYGCTNTVVCTNSNSPPF
jgi:hypothetical protein